MDASDGPLTPEGFLDFLDLDDALWAIAACDQGQGVTVREANAALATDIRHLRRLIRELVDRGYVEPARGIGRYRLTVIGRLWVSA